MKTIKRITVAFASVLFLIGLVPVSSFAVDPVSAATMANALAQAITTYGASQGVSMTYDVTNTDGIGESVHELWDQFKEDINDNNVPTYDSFAVTVWSTLFSKVNDHVAINLDATSVSYLDQFWNWLLSGPAEMTKVDNQYYEWTVNNGEVQPINILYLPLHSNLPTVNITGMTSQQIFNASQIAVEFIIQGTYNQRYIAYCCSSSGIVYGFYYNGRNIAFVSNTNGVIVSGAQKNNTNSFQSISDISVANTDSRYPGFYYHRQNDGGSYTEYNIFLPYYTSFEAGMDDLTCYLNNPTGDNLYVRPYIGDATPQDVYIPDNEDVNYDPLPYVGELDFPWTDSLYGDGTGTLTDAQSDAITSDISDAITQSDIKTLELAETAPAPGPGGTEVYIPLLPVTIPSFNFSFSGIWHYVVTWVQSLGSWMTMMFTVWSNLPYAIVIPVYASAVVVIIIGTLKRFL